MNNYWLWILALVRLLPINVHRHFTMVIPGSALTFCHMFFVTAQSWPSFISFSTSHFLPRFKPRQVPLTQWGLQVLVLTSGSLLNNWAFAYNVPLTILIVIRSGGEAQFLRHCFHMVKLFSKIQDSLYPCFSDITFRKSAIISSKL